MTMLASSAAAKSAEAKRGEIRRTRDAVLAELYERQPSVRERVRTARGYAVFANVGLNFFVVSTASGRGIVIKREPGGPEEEVFMSMFSAGAGVGMGLKNFRAVFIFHDAAALERFVTQGWDLSGQVDAAAKSKEKGASLDGAQTVLQGVEVFQLTKTGLALQATLQGTKYWPDKKLNETRR